MPQEPAQIAQAQTEQAQMWKSYAYKDFRVRVIQKWTDPYGRPMIRIADLRDRERAMGLPEADFLGEAELLPDQDDTLAE